MTLVRSLFVALVLISSEVCAVTAEAAPTRTDWLTPVVEAPRVSYHTFESRAVGTRISYHLYTPAAYDQNTALRYPVVYWLHGSGGGVSGIRPLAAKIDQAIAAGRVPPFMVVFVNGLRLGMYVDWKDGSVPMETIIVRELVPHIDAQYRTIATRKGRMLDGFSMGGYGAARFGFKYPERFRAVSIMGAGPMQEALAVTPRASPVSAAQLLRRVYGGDQAHFLAVSPRRLAEEHAATLRSGSLIRMVVGD